MPGFPPQEPARLTLHTTGGQTVSKTQDLTVDRLPKASTFMQNVTAQTLREASEEKKKKTPGDSSPQYLVLSLLCLRLKNRVNMCFTGTTFVRS